MRSGPKSGSSPRLRGTAGDGVPANLAHRFIPAPAGNRHLRRTSKNILTVHPRACGEQTLTSESASCIAGSSPRLRGTEFLGEIQSGIGRFIPAPAGNRSRRSCVRWPPAVHPRACGEQRLRGRCCRRSIGSSPRLRGTVQGVGKIRLRHRFIPAPAGNRTVARSFSSNGTVHPRACGEQHSDPRGVYLVLGSSPRLRGTGNPASTGWADHRFIPAPAGNRAMTKARP